MYEIRWVKATRTDGRLGRSYGFSDRDIFSRSLTATNRPSVHIRLLQQSALCALQSAMELRLNQRESASVRSVSGNERSSDCHSIYSIAYFYLFAAISYETFSICRPAAVFKIREAWLTRGIALKARPTSYLASCRVTWRDWMLATREIVLFPDCCGNQLISDWTLNFHSM